MEAFELEPNLNYKAAVDYMRDTLEPLEGTVLKVLEKSNGTHVGLFREDTNKFTSKVILKDHSYTHSELDDKIYVIRSRA